MRLTVPAVPLAAIILLVLLSACSDDDPTAPTGSPGSLAVPHHYLTIQAAMDAAVAGDTVFVAPGTYGGGHEVEIVEGWTVTGGGDGRAGGHAPRTAGRPRAGRDPGRRHDARHRLRGRGFQHRGGGDHRHRRPDGVHRPPLVARHPSLPLRGQRRGGPVQLRRRSVRRFPLLPDHPRLRDLRQRIQQRCRRRVRQRLASPAGALHLRAQPRPLLALVARQRRRPRRLRRVQRAGDRRPLRPTTPPIRSAAPSGSIARSSRSSARHSPATPAAAMAARCPSATRARSSCGRAR